MAKGDHSRSANRQDEQMKQSQGYLTGVQQNLANQSGNFNNLYWGGNPYGGSQVGGTFGYGSTVPHFSWTGSPYYGGNGTDTPTPISGGQGGRTFDENVFRSMFPGGQLSSDQLWSQRDNLMNNYGVQVMTNGAGQHGKIKLPNGEIVDVIGGMGAGGGVGSLQYNSDHGMRGFGGGGSIPGMAMQDYGQLMGMGTGLFGDYKNLFGDIKGSYAPFLGAASNMANTGGLSEGDKANLRARAISPIRAMYSNALQNVERQRALQGGYSPGFTTAMTRMNRDTGQNMSDATTNAEAAIAEMVQKGKLGGLSAWGSGLGGQTSGLLGALGGAGDVLRGMGGLYGTSPGMAQLFGQQALAAQAQQLQASQLQNQLSLGLMGNQNDISKIPGNYQSALGNISGTLGVGGQAAGLIYPFLGGGPNLGMGTFTYPGTSIGYAPGSQGYMDPNQMFNF